MRLTAFAHEFFNTKAKDARNIIRVTLFWKCSLKTGCLPTEITSTGMKFSILRHFHRKKPKTIVNRAISKIGRYLFMNKFFSLYCFDKLGGSVVMDLHTGSKDSISTHVNAWKCLFVSGCTYLCLSISMVIYIFKYIYKFLSHHKTSLVMLTLGLARKPVVILFQYYMYYIVSFDSLINEPNVSILKIICHQKQTSYFPACERKWDERTPLSACGGH